MNIPKTSNHLLLMESVITTCPAQWRHVSSKLNPTDHLTRGREARLEL